MKFFIINSFRLLVYNAYFAIIALWTFGSWLRQADIQAVLSQITTTGKMVAGTVLDPITGQPVAGMVKDPGMVLQPGTLSAVSIVVGLIVGWIAATVVCGLLTTILDIRDDINDRLPRAK